MTAKDDEKVSKEIVKDDGLITAVYKVNLHCHQCARDIRIPLMKTQGVHKVDVDFESHQITIKGMIDTKKIHQRIEKISKKKVEMISSQIKTSASTVETEKKAVKEDIKEPILRKTQVKVHLHCEQCEHDLEKMLLKHKGVYGVKIDTESQTITIDGTIEPDQLLAYIQKKVHKHAEIIPPPPPPPPKSAKKDEKKETVEVETKITESSTEIAESSPKKIEEIKEKKMVEEMNKDSNVNNVPYFIHYVYAPQTFSDENPNACCVM